MLWDPRLVERNSKPWESLQGLLQFEGTEEAREESSSAPMGRSMSWGLVPLVLLPLAGCSSVSGQARDCIDEWNRDGPHAEVAAEGFSVAELTAGENKALQPGCGLLFHTDPGRPWRIYWVVWNEDVRGPWGYVGGSSWGTDSPEGEVETTVQVRTDGTLAG
jgi:hypothetical protein